MYRQLDVDRILATAQSLKQRIDERFPESGLSRVAAELVETARDSGRRLHRLSQPDWVLRVAAVAGTLIVLATAAAIAVMVFRMSHEIGSRADLLQTVPAIADEMVLLGIAIFFLMNIEGRRKRGVALGALYELRSLAHVIDMHQLTKDPERLFPGAAPTASSPRRIASQVELASYLDYCSEMLSITSKLAALHLERLRDPVVLGAVRDIESLTGTLSGKIWQKMMILGRSVDVERKDAARNPEPEPALPPA